MKFPRPLILALVVGASLSAFAPDAEARRGRGGDSTRARVEMVTAPGAPFVPAEARVRVERRAGRQELRVQVEGVPAGTSLEVWFENAQGTLVRVGETRDNRRGEHVWRPRVRKGDALPFGAADVSELSGRVVQVRTTAGDPVCSATIPTIAAPAAKRFAKRPLNATLAVDGAVAGSLGAESLRAKVKVKRERDGDEEFKVEVESAPAGLELELWMDDGTGTLTFVGTLESDSDDGDSDDGVSSAPAKRGDGVDDGVDDGVGDDNGDDDGDGDGSDDSDDSDDDDASEYSYEVETDDGDALPLGVATVSDLAGRTIEVRTAGGEIVATGTVPTLAAPENDDDDDGDDDSAPDAPDASDASDDGQISSGHDDESNDD